MSKPSSPGGLPEDGPIIVNAGLITSADCLEQYPPAALPEVAFAGRSNVGKSSLLNLLLGRRSLVRVSRAPGRTRRLNFFYADERMALVDLPGYGYAQVSRSLRDAWGPMMEGYLLERANLVALAVLVDVRRKPEEEEAQLVSLAKERGLWLIPVATKVDQVTPGALQGRLQSIGDILGLPPGWVVPFSRLTRQGRGEIWRRMERAARPWRAAQEQAAAAAQEQAAAAAQEPGAAAPAPQPPDAPPVGEE